MHLGLATPAFTFFISHRIGTAYPFASALRLRRCHPTCTTLTSASPAAPNHPLHYAAEHAYHQMRCRCTNQRILVHNSLTRSTTAAISNASTSLHTEYTHLQSSANSRHQIDAIISGAHLTRSLAIDTTITCPLLPSYLADAALSASAIFETKAYRKIAKHRAGCASLERDFLPLVATTLGGVGPPALRDFLYGVFHRLASAADAEGSTTDAKADAARAFAQLQQTMQAIVARGNLQCVRRHIDNESVCARAAPAPP